MFIRIIFITIFFLNIQGKAVILPKPKVFHEKLKGIKKIIYDKYNGAHKQSLEFYLEEGLKTIYTKYALEQPKMIRKYGSNGVGFKTVVDFLYNASLEQYTWNFFIVLYTSDMYLKMILIALFENESYEGERAEALEYWDNIADKPLTIKRPCCCQIL